MTTGRGGPRTPPPNAAPSGPGKFSKRTDNAATGQGQKIQVPNVGDSPDLQYGDRSRLEDAQRIAKAASSAPVGGSSQGVTGLASSGEGLPPWLTEMASNRPNEPVTAGLDMGQGPGSEVLQNQMPGQDIRETILLSLYTTYRNEDALRDLQKMRAEKVQSQMPPAPMMQSPPEMEPPVG